jgi:membrane fusion protein, copper/silver efflux system
MIARTRIALVCAAAALMLVCAGCNSDRAGRAETTPQPMIPKIVRQAGQPDVMMLRESDVPGAKLAEVREIQLPAVLETTGQITFNDRDVSTIVSRVQGRIEQTRVSLWDNVRRGEKIVALYSPDFMTAEAEYLQAMTTAKFTAAPQLGVSGANMGEAMVSAARRKLELLGMDDTDIARLTQPDPTVWMRAPIGGTVVENKALRGAAVNPGDVLYTLGTLSTVWITADIYEDDLARVHAGQSLQAVTTAYPNEVFNGVIDRISPAIDPTTHTLQIRCAVRNPGLKLKPQMLARIRIVTRPGTALVVPQDALVFETNRYFAFVQTGPATVERRQVDIATWSGSGRARVISGLRAGERVITGQTMQVNALWHAAHGESS